MLKPTQGSVRIGELDTRERGTTKKIVTKVGYVFQNPDHQLFNNTVHKEIAYGPRNIGLDAGGGGGAGARGRPGLRREGGAVRRAPLLPHQGAAPAGVDRLDPGHAAPVIIVDEPTTGQDRRQSVEVMNFLRDLWEKGGHTVIIITHEMPIVSEYARRCVVLSRGKVLMDGDTREVFASPEVLAQTFVKPPQITRLAQALGAYGIRKDVLSIEEMAEEFRKATSS